MDNNKQLPLEQLRQIRLEKLNKFKELGINAYPSTSNKDTKNIEVSKNYEKLEGKEVILSGRVVTKRHHGKLIFLDIKDSSGIAQLYIKKDELKDADNKLGELEYKQIIDLIDISDFVEAKGIVTKTLKGEKSLEVKNFKIQSKALRQIPVELNDKETRYRKRYLDLQINEETRRVFDIRHKLSRYIREFLNQELEHTEVETPVLQPLYGGANAKPFTTHFNSVDSLAFLRIAPELYLKRLIVGGFEGVYEFAKNFRNEGIDQTHYPEFTMLEIYTANINYEGMMDNMEKMIKFITPKVLGSSKIIVKGKEIEVDKKWDKISVKDALKERFDIDADTITREELLEFADKNKLDYEEGISEGELKFLIFDDLITPTFITPTWAIDYPVEISPLAKEKYGVDKTVERFELYIGGKEIMDGFSELNNAITQRERFEAEHYRKIDESSEAKQPIDEDFIEALEYGTPPFAGIGIGMERLTMFFSDVWQIQETMLFPFKKVNNKAIKDYVKSTTNSNNYVIPTKEEALTLLEKHVKNEYQLHHAKMVANAMEFFAKEKGEDELLWYVTGLLHDIDYEEYPDTHPNESLKWFKDLNYSPSLIKAVEAHAYKRLETDKPFEDIEKYLYAIDELSGLIYAYSIMRKGYEGMESKGVVKKIKDKKFAAKINREEIKESLELIDLERKDFITKLIGVFKDLE